MDFVDLKRKEKRIRNMPLQQTHQQDMNILLMILFKRYITNTVFFNLESSKFLYYLLNVIYK